MFLQHFCDSTASSVNVKFRIDVLEVRVYREIADEQAVCYFLLALAINQKLENLSLSFCEAVISTSTSAVNTTVMHTHSRSCSNASVRLTLSFSNIP